MLIKANPLVSLNSSIFSSLLESSKNKIRESSNP